MQCKAKEVFDRGAGRRLYAHAGILPAIINRSNSLMTRQERLPEREECVEQAGDEAERI